MKRRKQQSNSSHERWLVSYADFITLLFAFFVVLYASAEVDRKRVGQLSQSIHTAFQELGAFPPGQTAAVAPPAAPPPGATDPDATPDEIHNLKQELENALANEIDRQYVSIHIGPEGLVLSLREAGFFNSGSAQVRPEAGVAFDTVAKVLRQQPRALRIEGHTDNVPIHNGKFASNWELSTARATEIVRLLITEHGLSPDKLSAAGYAEFHPVADNSSEDGRKKNRRVDILVRRESHPHPFSNPDDTD